MAIVKKSFVCPYCFEKNDLFRIEFRCQNDPAKCMPEVDEVYGNFRNITSPPMSKVFGIPNATGSVGRFKDLLNFKLPKKLACPSCREKSQLRICPNCHSELPYTIGDYQDLTIAIIGAKEAGKSHYIAVLIDQIRHQIGRFFNANLQPVNDETINRYRKDFYNPLYRNQEIISATRSARAEFETKSPMVYILSFMKKKLWGKEAISDVSTLTFFDTAGEDLDSEELMRTENKYIYNSQGIILLIDPLQIGKVRRSLGGEGEMGLPQQNTESEDIISRLARLIKRANGLSEQQQIKVPLAIAFSKIDALNNLIDSSFTVNRESKHNGYFDLQDFESVNTEMEALLEHWEGDHITRQVKHNFANYAFFGLSALGTNPHGGDKVNRIHPRRVVDPFLWLLYQHKLLKAK